MGFIMDGLDAEAYDRTYKDSQLVVRIAHYFRPKTRIIVFLTVLIVLSSLLDTAFPLLVSQGLDALTSSTATRTAILLVVFILVSGIL